MNKSFEFGNSGRDSELMRIDFIISMHFLYFEATPCISDLSMCIGISTCECNCL